MDDLQNPRARAPAPLHEAVPSGARTFIVFKRGGMGSILASLPFVARLRAWKPDSWIVFITDSSNCELVDRCGVADEVVTAGSFANWTSGWHLARGVAQMRRRAPSVFFDLQMHTHRLASAWLAAASGADLRVGFYRPSDSVRQHVFDTLVLINMFAPVHDLYMQMARAIGCPVPDRLPPVSPSVAADDTQQATALLHPWVGSDHRLLVVNPNTSDKAIERRWPLSLFREALAGIMARRGDVRVALIGSADQVGYVEQLRQSIGAPQDRVQNLAGRTSLGSLLALLQQADCVLTNDSGPFHFSVALGTPTVGLFGPVHPDHYGRMGRTDRTTVFYHPMVCSPCVHFVHPPPCGGDNHCMKAIAPAEVENACLLLLSGVARAYDTGWHFSQPPETTSDEGGPLGVWHRVAHNRALRSVAPC